MWREQEMVVEEGEVERGRTVVLMTAEVQIATSMRAAGLMAEGEGG